MTPRPAPVPVPVQDPDCAAAGSDDPVTGIKKCILARQVAHISAQSSSDTQYDTKENPYVTEAEAFENPIPPIDRLVFLSYILFILILICIISVFTSNLSGIRKNTLLIFAFLLILLLAILQKRDAD
jgi:hypothetical protein